jgi:hypothetical protein
VEDDTCSCPPVLTRLPSHLLDQEQAIPIPGIFPVEFNRTLLPELIGAL